MEPSIAPRDRMIYNFANAPFGVSDETSLNILSRLSKKYPGSDVIRRGLARKLRETCRFEAAMEEYFGLFLRSGKKEDITGLLICSLQTQRFGLYFLDMKLHRRASTAFPILEKVVAIFESKVFEVDYEKYIKTEYPIVASTEQSTEYCDAFSGMYTKCIRLIQKRKCAEAFDMLTKMLKTTSIHETIELLVQSERVELLYYLSQQFLFFEKYYRAAEVAVNRRLVNVFALVVESCSEGLVTEFCEILKCRDQALPLLFQESSF